MSKEWKRDALHLWLSTELTKSEIARKVGKPRTTVRDYLNKRASQDEYVEPVLKDSKVLVFDLETYRCKSCGKIQRDGVNQLSKEKRAALMRNVS